MKPATLGSTNHISVPVIGKDVLELLSSSMYLNPITIYREYIQNAADSIDDALQAGILSERDTRQISIDFDSANRSVKIRDNGTGIAEADFVSRLTRIGASEKARDKDRGFRGVGRLAGLGFCQELIFRSRSVTDSTTGELRWDCRLIKQLLRSPDHPLSLQEVISRVVTNRRVTSEDESEHFFEVELKGLIRQSNDRLFSQLAVYDYLAQVAPVPFHPDFKFGDAISERLRKDVKLGELQISISGIGEPVYRPYQDSIVSKATDHDMLTDLEMISVPSLDGEEGAILWLAHHNYKGAVPDARIRGLRARAGNLQVGDNDLFQEQFGETRFNAWTIGEIHILDPRILPNGRRDHFEQNAHFDNLANHIAPLARSIGNRCRESSKTRNMQRIVGSRVSKIEETLGILKTGVMSNRYREKLKTRVEEDLAALRRAVPKGSEASEALFSRIDKLERRLRRIPIAKDSLQLEGYSATKRNAFEKVLDLIYECSSDHADAAKLVSQIVSGLASERARHSGAVG